MVDGSRFSIVAIVQVQSIAIEADHLELLHCVSSLFLRQHTKEKIDSTSEISAVGIHGFYLGIYLSYLFITVL